ncbi:MAG: hypothetical protein ACE5DM_02225 [Candidatus Nanoarchaeia archaeon]
MRKIFFLIIVCILLASIVSALKIQSPFKSVEIDIGKGEKPANPVACENDRDCEWRGCGCFSKDSDKSCSENLTEKGCMCLNSFCAPDLLASMQKNGLNLKRYEHKMLVSPECPDSSFFALNDARNTDTGMMILAFKGIKGFDGFLDLYCEDPLIDIKIDRALGGSFFDQCQGFDFKYDQCKALNENTCDSWLERRNKDFEKRLRICEATFKNCSSISDAKKRIKKNLLRCGNNATDYIAHCNLNCDNMLQLKEQCEAKQDKGFKREVHRKVKSICSSRNSKLEKARRTLVDEELSASFADIEIRIDKYKDSQSFLRRVMDQIDILFGKSPSSHEDKEDIKEALGTLREETDNPTVHEAINQTIEELS